MNSARTRRIGVLVGGEDPERLLSVEAGAAVLGALQQAGYEATAIFVDRDLDLWLRQERIEVAFLALRGRSSIGPVQGLLETLGIPYTGSSFAATALAADKLKSKELFRLHNLPTPVYYRHARDLGSAIDQHHGFGYPCVVKPRTGGAGGVVVETDDQLQSAVEVALRIDDELVIERQMPGVEVQVIIVDGQVLGAAEVVSHGGHGGSIDFGRRSGPQDVFLPPRISADRLRGLLTQAVRAHHLLGCDGCTLVDLVLTRGGNEQLIGVDTVLDLSPGALLPRVAKAAGLRFDEVVVRLLEGARLHAGRRLRERREAQLPLMTADRRSVGSVETH